MPQISHAYAVGRTRALSKALIPRAAIDRLVSAGSVDELMRVTQELGYGDVRSQADIERAIDSRMAEACRFVRKVTPEPELTDCFMLKYDIINLKTLYKSRTLGQSAESLSKLGTLDADKLARAVESADYKILPDKLRSALVALDKRQAVRIDPMLIDAELDKAMFAMTAEKLKRVKNADAKAYFSAKADFTNLITALRAAHMGRGAAFAEALMVEGGIIPLPDALKLADEPESAWKLIRRTPYANALRAAVEQDPLKQLPLIEKRADDYLTSLIRPHRYEPTSVMPLIGYLIANEREAAAVRMLTTAKSAGVKPEAIASRLRELYA